MLSLIFITLKLWTQLIHASASRVICLLTDYVSILFWQLVCLATFLKVSENDVFDPSQVTLFFNFVVIDDLVIDSVKKFLIPLLLLFKTKKQILTP